MLDLEFWSSLKLMPRACPVVANVRRYKPALEKEIDATGLSRGVSRFVAFHLQISDLLAIGVNDRASRGHLSDDECQNDKWARVYRVGA